MKMRVFVFCALGIYAWVVSLRPVAADSFPDICSLKESLIKVGSTIKVRAAEIPVGSWYIAGLTGKSCIGKTLFIVEKNESSRLADEVNSAINHHSNLSVEADMTLYMEEFRKGPPKSKPASTWHVVIKSAKNFRLIPIEFSGN